MPAHRKCNHDGPRFTSSGACKECQVARRKVKRQAAPGRVNAYNRKRRAENPERENKYGRKYRASELFAAWYSRNRPKELWKKAKQRAVKSKREFNITVQDVERLLALSARCPYTGVLYDNSKRGRNPWASSLDRKDSTRGYTLDNLEVTSVWWNLAKNSWNAEVTRAALCGLRTYKP